MKVGKWRMNRRKKASIAAAAVLMTMTLLTGTLAWQSISQKALNENKGQINPGGRLHDDYDGENKDVYVENYGDEQIFARIRLDEYMELGEGAGLKGSGGIPDPNNKAVSIETSADINDVKTWTTHIPNGQFFSECTVGFHYYWDWIMGGKKWYMPTFNKDNTSLLPDQPNPSNIITDPLALPSPIVAPPGSAHDYWDDDNYKDQWDSALGVDGPGVTANVQTHIPNPGTIGAAEQHFAKQTVDGTVISMQQWIANGRVKGAFWVYDTDGWAYWAQAIEPHTATGLLLSAIELNLAPDEDYYYGINVVGQFASNGDWGDQDNPVTGFYDTAGGEYTIPSADARYLLDQAAGRLPHVTRIELNQPAKSFVPAGGNIEFKATVTVKYPAGTPQETNVDWSITPSTTAFAGGIFSPALADVGNTYTVTATSSFDSSFSQTSIVYVYPSGAAGVVPGKTDGKYYVNYGDNTFKEIGSDGSLGSFKSAGGDHIIGNSDDKTSVVTSSTGVKFIGPNGDASYYVAGANALLGDADDTKVWPNPDLDNTTNTNPTTGGTSLDILVIPAGMNPFANLGGTLNLTSLVIDAGVSLTGSDLEVTWSFAPGTVHAVGTKLSTAGPTAAGVTMTVDALEQLKSITIRATSVRDPAVIKDITIFLKT